MKKYLLFALSFLALSASAQDNYELRVLTFEDKDYVGGPNFVGMTDWSSLIDDPQYGGVLLYGESGSGVDGMEKAYKWSDDGNTFLANVLCDGYGSFCYWTGGEAISNYGSRDIETYGDFMNQLTVFNSNGSDTDVTREGHGHNGSNNFAMHYGYVDQSGYGTDVLSEVYFSDGVARVIDHMYVTNNTYAINCYMNGNDLTANIGPDDWVKIIVTGYNGEATTGTAEIYLCNGPEDIIMEWTKFDLSSLGEVTKVSFNVAGSSDNGYGFSQPAYFAWDDMAVRFPKLTVGVDAVDAEESGDGVWYDLHGRRVMNPSHGVFIRNGRKVFIP